MKINFMTWWDEFFKPREGKGRRRSIADRTPTPMHKASGGMGKTRASHEESKTTRIMAARSRRINRGGSKRK